MMHIDASQAHADRRGRPLLFSVTEAVVLVLVAAALIATAAVPAAVRHPHVVRAQAITATADRP